MLVLSRKVDESIMIGDNIEVMVTSIRGGRVRLGFRAPPNTSIQRKERLDGGGNDRLDKEPNGGGEGPDPRSGDEAAQEQVSRSQSETRDDRRTAPRDV